MWLRLAAVTYIAAGVLHSLMGQSGGILVDAAPLVRVVWHLAGIALIAQGLTLWLAVGTGFAGRAAWVALGLALVATIATGWAGGMLTLPPMIFALVAVFLILALTRRGDQPR